MRLLLAVFVETSARLGSTLKRLDERRTLLADILQDPAFSRLPAESQQAVSAYYDEIDRYLKLSDEAQAKVRFPFMAKTEEEFAAQEKDLRSFTYPTEWQDTPLGKRIGHAQKEYERVREELMAEESWLLAQIDASNKLLDAGTELQFKLRKKKAKLEPQEAELWELSYRRQMQSKPRVPRTANIPGVSGLTYEFLDKFGSIKDARKRWDAVKVQLKRVADNIQDDLRSAP